MIKSQLPVTTEDASASVRSQNKKSICSLVVTHLRFYLLKPFLGIQRSAIVKSNELKHLLRFINLNIN